jgi:hypothetical protein
VVEQLDGGRAASLPEIGHGGYSELRLKAADEVRSGHLNRRGDTVQIELGITYVRVYI